MTTLHELARLARVHTSTVSRALRDDHRISATVRQRIKRLADDAGYRPHRAAQQLVGRRCQTVYLTCSDLTTPRQARLTMACAAAAGEAGLDLLLGADTGDAAKARHALRQLGPGRVDGLLLLPSAASDCTSELAQLHLAGLRLVALGQRPPHLDIPCIGDDEGMAAESLIRSLAARGCRQLFCPLSAGSSSGASRLAACRAAAKRIGLPLANREPLTNDEGHIALLSDDATAATASCRRLGPRAPVELHLAFFHDPADDRPDASRVCASLTGLRRDETAWATRAIACLLDPTLPGVRLTPNLCSG